MAKNKKTKKQAPQSSPATYIRTRMRSLPIGKCYLLPGWKEQGITVAIVTRLHPKGTYSYATYMIDVWCRGLADTSYRFNISADEFKDDINYMSQMYPDPFEEVDYALVHNILYGAIEFAGEVELMPHPDWALTQFFLMDDDDDEAPYMELEFGRNGKYVLCVHDKLQRSLCQSKLDRIIGPGNYEYIIEEDDEEYDPFGVYYDDYFDDYYDDSSDDSTNYYSDEEDD